MEGWSQNIFPCWENNLPAKRNESTKTIIIKDKKLIINYNNKIKEKRIKKRKNIINHKIIIIRNYILINLIKLVMIKIFCQINSNIL